jgi:flagellar protein FliO/FliZ
MQTVELAGRLILSLAVVLAVVWLLARKLRGGARIKDTRLIDVLSRQQLTRTASVAVVRVGDKALVIGVTDTGVNVLGETDLSAAQAAAENAKQAKAARKPAAPSHRRPTATAAAAPPRPAPPVAVAVDGQRGPLAGSALSPQTWRQTIESLRDLTSR